MGRGGADECIVDSITLNDFEGTDLEAELDWIRREREENHCTSASSALDRGEGELPARRAETRLGIDELATCSALTASASRTQYFNALSQLDKILGVAASTP